MHQSTWLMLMATMALTNQNLNKNKKWKWGCQREGLAHLGDWQLCRPIRASIILTGLVGLPICILCPSMRCLGGMVPRHGPTGSVGDSQTVMLCLRSGFRGSACEAMSRKTTHMEKTREVSWCTYRIQGNLSYITHIRAAKVNVSYTGPWGW